MKSVYKDKYLNFEYNDTFIEKELADELLEKCGQLDWPKQIKPRRTSITFGDEGLIYTIVVNKKSAVPKKIYRKAINWDNFEILKILKKKVENYTGLTFNFCAILRYENGDINIKRHQDGEVVNGASICGVSIGDSRTFILSPPYYVNVENVSVNLSHGSIYCMHPPTNSHWYHEILPEKNKGLRYSLTFRNIPVDVLAKEIPVSTTKKCVAIIKSGQRKGTLCGAGTETDYCKRHSRAK